MDRRLPRIARAGRGGVVSEAIALDALTTGAIGVMTIGMMTRTARGHMGRPLETDR